MTMRTLYIRNVPDDVAAYLDELAERDNLSLNALVVRELTEVAARSRNRGLLATLPRIPIDVDEVVEGIRKDRESR